MSDLRAFARPEPQPFRPGDPIPANGDGELHPDVIRLRHQLSGAGTGLLRRGDYAALVKYLGGDWTVKRLMAAHAYFKARDRRPT